MHSIHSHYTLFGSNDVTLIVEDYKKRFSHSVAHVCFHTENASETDWENFKKELKTMTGIKPHPNVIQLLGACLYKGTREEKSQKS